MIIGHGKIRQELNKSKTNSDGICGFGSEQVNDIAESNFYENDYKEKHPVSKNVAKLPAMTCRTDDAKRAFFTNCATANSP